MRNTGYINKKNGSKTASNIPWVGWVYFKQKAIQILETNHGTVCGAA
jgi:hypothetical protein